MIGHQREKSFIDADYLASCRRYNDTASRDACAQLVLRLDTHEIDRISLEVCQHHFRVLEHRFGHEGLGVDRLVEDGVERRIGCYISIRYGLLNPTQDHGRWRQAVRIYIDRRGRCRFDTDL